MSTSTKYEVGDRLCAKGDRHPSVEIVAFNKDTGMAELQHLRQFARPFTFDLYSKHDWTIYHEH